jgi:uncharacterized protein YndB with AHSA1/START domain
MLVLLLCIIVVLPASATVVTAAANNFVVTTTVIVRASPQVVFEALTREPAQWWDSAHTWSGSATNLSLEPRAGGCFCEALPNGGSVKHAEVLYLEPNKILRMQGNLGPLQAMPVFGVLTFQIADDAGGARIEMTYGVSGAIEGDLAGLAKAVDNVLAIQTKRLAEYSERIAAARAA